jgi:hypothetical protein
MPKMSTKLPRTESITMRVDANFKRCVESAASQDGRTVSNWLERIVGEKLAQLAQIQGFSTGGTPLMKVNEMVPAPTAILGILSEPDLEAQAAVTRVEQGA